MNEHFIERAKFLAARHEKMRRDPRYRTVMSFLVKKGFLICENLQPAPSRKISIVDALWVGRKIEPRVLEVLPAAILAFRGSFGEIKSMPAELKELLVKLQNLDESGSDWEGIPYEKFKIWAELPLTDRRTKLLINRRVTRSFRILPEVANRIRFGARQSKISESRWLESIVMNLNSAVEETPSP